uniref:Eukaryotic translation initiation factor 5B n=1 Tax=Cacopsylla melanoneura TaxID=428564 RepID=A0A8D8XQB9_9HEMI
MTIEGHVAPMEGKKSKKGKKKEAGENGVTEDNGGGNDAPASTSESTAKPGAAKKKDAKKPAAKDDKAGAAAKAKGPGKKTLAAMQEALKKIKEEEEAAKQEEEERIRREDEEENRRLEQLRLEQERKEKKKAKEKERKERLKAEGKFLTPKQKADKARAQATLEMLKAQGIITIPSEGEKKPRPGTRIRPKKSNKTADDKSNAGEPNTTDNAKSNKASKDEDKGGKKKKESKLEEDEDDILDSWDVESSDNEEEEEEEEEDGSDDNSEETEVKTNGVATIEKNVAALSLDKEEVKEKAVFNKRREKIEENPEDENFMRAAIVCVLGHVDTGKTKILDKLRRTNVQDGEAGGITQQIGATNVPVDAIRENTKHVRGPSGEVGGPGPLEIPGLLIIDTPGHESFSNLRNRGSSLCDIAILVVDIMHGLEPQTIESINILKSKKTPFVVALNKIDRLYNWSTMNRRDVRDIIKSQEASVQSEFETRFKDVAIQFSEQGLNAALFYDNPDPKSYVSMVPTSAITGEGMGNLLALIVQYCQSFLRKRLMFKNELQATVLEVKAIPGLGTTIDTILVNGTLYEGDTVVLAGTDGPIVTQIRSLLMPQPMQELRVKNAYMEYKKIKGTQGVKIAAKDLEKTIAGLNLRVAKDQDDIDEMCEEVSRELKSALSTIKLQERGVYVQASTLGSLEALLEFLRTSSIPYSNIRIGPVVKKDVMRASIMLEHESQYATILAFDVKVERDAQELADSVGVKIFQADIIYHLFDKFTAFREELKAKKREEFKHIAVFPCRLKVLPQFVFNSRDPIVMGVIIEAGVLREGTPICVPSREFVELGIVTSVENNHKPVEMARKGQEVCIKIEPIPGEAPKMFGRHFDEKDFLVSKISRQSIDACKDYFRDDLTKPDWQLMVDLKKVFQIL